MKDEMNYEKAWHDLDLWVQSRSSARPQFMAVVKDAMEKMVAKKVEVEVLTDDEHERYPYIPITTYYCPTCGDAVDDDSDSHCPSCGQKLGWGDGDD